MRKQNVIISGKEKLIKSIPSCKWLTFYITSQFTVDKLFEVIHVAYL